MRTGRARLLPRSTRWRSSTATPPTNTPASTYTTMCEPGSHIVVYVLAGVLVGGVAVLLRHLVDRGSSLARPVLIVFAGLWHLATGLAGVALAALWIFTNHVYS